MAGAEDVEDLGEEGGGLCLICGGSAPNNLETSIPSPSPLLPPGSCYFGGDYSVALSQDLDVYFVLRHVLQLPSGHLEKYLRKCSIPPRDWLKFCRSCCGNYVDKCKGIFVELLEVKKRFKTASLEMIEMMKKTGRIGGQARRNEDLEEDEDEYGLVLDVFKEVRRFVKNHEYEQFEIFSGGLTSNEEKLISMAIKREHEDDNLQQILTGIKSEPFDDAEAPEMILGLEPVDFLLNENDEDEDASSCDANDDPIDPDWEKSSEKNVSGSSEEEQEEEEDDDDEQPTEQVAKKKPSRSRRKVTDRKKIKSVDKRLKPHTKLSKYDCKLCDKTLKNWLTYKKHMKHHQLVKLNGPKPFQCDICQTKFSWKSTMVAHKKMGICSKTKPSTPSTPAAPPKCSECNLTFQSRKNLYRHKKRLHSKTPIQETHPCDKCDAILESRDDRRRHQIKIHNINHYQCPLCDFKAEARGKIDIHKRDEHGVKLVWKKAKTATCPICEKTISSNYRLNLHMSTIHKISKLGKWICEHCGKEFFVKWKYYNHLGAAHGIKDELKYHCQFEGCTKAFYRQSQLNYHLESHTTEETENICEFCSAVYKRRKTLNEHIKEKHSDDPPKTKSKGLTGVIKQYKCSVCEDVFYKKGPLREHEKSAHGIKPYGTFTCEVCSKVLSSHRSLKLHQRSIHNIGDFQLPKYPCSWEGCSRLLQSKGDLEQHVLKVHHGLDLSEECKVCGKRVKCISNHMRDVHGENQVTKPFRCELCGKGFAVMKYLKQHLNQTHQLKQDLQD